MTFVTPQFTPLFRVVVKQKFHKDVFMRFEVVGDSVAHAETKAAAFIEDRHRLLANKGYALRATRIRRDNKEATVLV